MKKVLIITYYWPPAGGPGVQRWLKFVKYLPEYNITPIIFVPEKPNYPIIDESLIKDVSNDLDVIKFPIFELSKFLPKIKSLNLIRSGNVAKPENQSLFHKLIYFIRGNLFIPDMKIFWKRKSVNFLLNYLSKNKIDTIITTGPPHSIHLIGLEIKRKTNIKWIADFRDPWVKLNYLNKFKLLQFVKNKHRKLRDEVLVSADSVIVTSQKLKNLFSEINPNVFKITNGYDFNYSKVNLDTKFSISHVGSLYNDRNPEFFWDIIEDKYNSNKDFKNKLQVNFIGNNSQKLIKYFSAKNFSSCVNFINYVDYKTALKYICSTQVLLMLEANDEESSYAIPGKLFDYLNSKRPIIAIGPKNSDINSILSETNSGKFFNYDKKESLKFYIDQLYNKYKNNRLISINSTNITAYSRNNLTKKLSKIINRENI